EDEVVIPDGQRLFGVFRIAEVDGAREVLFAAVDAPRGEQLLRADHAEELALLVADEVLPTVAARHGQVAGAEEASVGDVRDEGGVLVVGMRGNVERAAEMRQLRESKLKLGRVFRVCPYGDENREQCQGTSGALHDGEC